VSAAPPRFAALAAAALETGLLTRGGFHPAPGDSVPSLGPGRPTASVVLLGNVGASLWPVFSVSAEYRDGRPDPLDRWSRRVVDALAVRFGARAAYPFDGPPWLPFQRWAMRAEPVFASPIGPLVHVRHGLWHAYRGALLFADHVDLPPRESGDSPCESCAARPCLHTCPVGALQPGGYDVPTCTAHIATRAGGDCLEQGCRARRACPVGQSSPYPPAQQALHMRAFLAAHRAVGDSA
jgi:hypothetical protein